MTIRKALLTLKGYCGKHITCSNCSLKNWCDYMFIHDGCVPNDWDVDEILEKRRGDSDGHK